MVGVAMVLLATPAAAQVHVDVGVLTHNGGVRVAVGAPRVYAVDEDYEAIYVPDDHHSKRERARERAKHEREYYKDIREARREYEKDRREAEREHLKDRREAEREYLKDRREAQREYEKDRREAWRDRRR